MNKLQRYSLHAGLKISKPFVNDCYYPFTKDKYITFNTSSKVQSKHYDLWQEVVDLISPFLKKNNISIVQLGDAKDPEIQGVYRLCGATNFNQSSYLLKSSLLHFNSCDHFSYLAYNSGVKLISLFSNEPSSSFCFEQNSNCHFIDSPKEKYCSYSVIENPKTINKISPPEIAFKILSELNIKNNINDFDFLFAGESFPVRIIEIIPDFIPDQNFLKKSLVNLRADLHLDENILFQFSKDRQLGIITDKALSPDLCFAIKNSVARMSIDASCENLPDFLLNLKKFNINYELFSFNEKEITDLRLKYIDEKISLFKRKTKKDVDIDFDTCNNLVMNSSKIILSKGKKFASKAHWITGNELKDGHQDIIDTSDFWEDSDYYIIYRKEKNGKRKTKG